MTKVAVLIGSLRKDSINRKFARALEKLAAGRLEFVYADLANLPHTMTICGKTRRKRSRNSRPPSRRRTRC